GAQKANSSDAQQNLLHDARGAIAAVNPERQIPKVLFVLRQVRVQQINRATTDVYAPGLKMDDVHRNLDRTYQRFAIRVENGLDWKISGIEEGVVIGLPIIVVDQLLKVTFAVKQTHSDEAQAQITRRLCVISCQNPETA